ncbi:MAG: hypothetical protein MJ091_06120 [Clostridia bacterium]|nr:hypothetical protein [Clostridia bacterium]
MDEQKAIERVKRETAYRNKYNASHYDRIATTFPLGTRERISSSGDSLNNYIKQAVLEKLERDGL